MVFALLQGYGLSTGSFENKREILDLTDGMEKEVSSQRLKERAWNRNRL